MINNSIFSGARMIKLSLIRTCSACPSQWEGTTDKGEDVYIRYRHGEFSIEINHEVVYERSDFKPKYEGGGYMTNDELSILLKERGYLMAIDND